MHKCWIQWKTIFWSSSQRLTLFWIMPSITYSQWFILQLLPQIYEWTTYRVCSILKEIWTKFKGHAVGSEPVPHYWIELMATLECVLNYGHTRNLKVLTKGLMDLLWLFLSLINDGFPSISPIFITTPLFATKINICVMDWPIKANKSQLASMKSQLINYGPEHYNVKFISL